MKISSLSCMINLCGHLLELKVLLSYVLIGIVILLEECHLNFTTCFDGSEYESHEFISSI